MITDATPGRSLRIRRRVTDATRIAEWDEAATDADLMAEQRLIQMIKKQLHDRDQQILAILTERGRARREEQTT